MNARSKTFIIFGSPAGFYRMHRVSHGPLAVHRYLRAYNPVSDCFIGKLLSNTSSRESLH